MNLDVGVQEGSCEKQCISECHSHQRLWFFLHNWAYKQRAFSAAPVSVWTLFFSLQKPLYYCFLFLYYSCQDGGVTMKNESHIRKVIVLLGETEASVLRWKILLEHILLLNVNSLQIVYKLAPAQDVTVCEITFMPTVPLAVAKDTEGGETHHRAAKIPRTFHEVNPLSMINMWPFSSVLIFGEKKCSVCKVYTVCCKPTKMVQ